MLREEPSDGNISPGIVSRIRSALARNVANNNPGIAPSEFPGIIDQLIFDIIAVRLLGNAGAIRGPGLETTVPDLGLSGGLYLILENAGDRDKRPPVYSGNHQPGQYKITVPRVTVDPDLADEILQLTTGKEFFDEWINIWQYDRETSLALFAGRQVKLKEGNRAAIEEKQVKEGYTGHCILPGAYISQVTGDVLAERLSGLSPAFAGLPTILDPCCGTGRFLICAFRILLDWHRSWYLQHLVPLVEQGKDPASRRVQQLLPPELFSCEAHGGHSFGFLPLPVCKNEKEEWVLTWEEKVRIFNRAIYGVDVEQQAVTLARLSLLSVLLNDPLSQEISGFSQEMVFNSLFHNIRCGNTLAGPGYGVQYTDPTPAPLPFEEHNDWQGFSYEGAFSHVMEAGGFDLVLGRYPEKLGGPRKRVRDYLAGHYLTRKKTEHAAPFFIERGISILRDGGTFCMTGDGSWLQDPACAPLRLWLRQFRIDRIVDFRDHPLLMKGKKPLFLLSLIRHPGDQPLKAIIGMAEPGDQPGRYVPSLTRLVSKSMLSDGPWILHDIRPERVRAKILEKGTPLSQLTMGEYFSLRGAVPGWTIIDRKTRERITRKDPVAKSWLLPYIRKEDFSRYGPVRPDYYLISIPPGTTRALAGDTGNLWGWFSSCHHTLAGIIESRGMTNKSARSGTGRCWWEWPADSLPAFLRHQVFIFRPGDTMQGYEWTIAPAGAFPGPGVLAMPGKDPAVLGILNSKLFVFFLAASGRRSGKSLYSTTELLNFPVYIPDPDNPEETRLWHELAHKVTGRLAFRSGGAIPFSGGEPEPAPGDAGRVEGQIDHLVARIYGLPDDDVMVLDYCLKQCITKKRDARPGRDPNG